MNIETLTTTLDFIFKDKNLKLYDKAILDTAKKIQGISTQTVKTKVDTTALKTMSDGLTGLLHKVHKFATDKVEVEITTKGGEKTIKQMSKLQYLSVRTAQAIHKVGNASMSPLIAGLKKASSIAGNLASTVAKLGAGAVVGAGAIAKSTAEKSQEARSYGSDYKTIMSMQQGLKGVSDEAVLAVFEEMKNKIGLTATALEKKLKSTPLSHFNAKGYKDAKGKQKAPEKLEESTLNDLINSGAFQKASKAFEGMTNNAKIFQKFNKMSANSQIALMADIVDMSPKWISSMDDWIGLDSTKVFSQARVEAQKLGITINELWARNKSKQIMSEKDIDQLNVFSNSIDSIGRTIYQVLQKMSAGVGVIISPLLDGITKKIQDNKGTITKYVDSIVVWTQQKITDITAWVNENLFNASGEFVGIQNAFITLKAKAKEIIDDMVNYIVGVLREKLETEFNTTFQNISSMLTEWLTATMTKFRADLHDLVLSAFSALPALVLTAVSALFTLGYDIGTSIKVQLTEVFTSIGSMISNKVSEWFGMIKKFAGNAIDTAKSALGLTADNPIAQTADNGTTKPTNSLGAFGGSQPANPAPQAPAVPKFQALPQIQPKNVFNNNATSAPVHAPTTNNVVVNVSQSNASAKDIGVEIARAMPATNIKSATATTRGVSPLGRK